MYLCEVYVTNASLNVNKPFTYFCDEKIDKYTRVSVKFHNSANNAIVTKCEFVDKSIDELNNSLGYKIQPILSVIDNHPILSDELFELAIWLSKTTISPLVSCINSLLPKALRTSKKIVDPKRIEYIKKNTFSGFATTKQKEVYDKLFDGMKVSDARKISTSIVAKLIDYGAIDIYKQEAEYQNNEIEQSSFKTLNSEQAAAYNGILETKNMCSLLFGVTGSGKTEVYLHLAKHYLEKDKEVLILVPEISLTPQMIQRVKERFSDVIFYHSELNDQEKYEQYKRVLNGEVKIVVGTRSSIFLPFKNLGLIIVDEEHDSSYKQDSTPCYHVRNVAIKRAITHNAKVLFASATPSLESYTRALKKEYSLFRLNNRINQMFPNVEIVDLNNEVRNKGSYILSKRLKEELSNCLSCHKQAIILLNRRGYTPIIKCSSCGKTLMCHDCDVPLNYHRDENVLKCHHCGRTYKYPYNCPNCHEKSLISYGFGTEKVEEILNKEFPHAKTIRMDRDTTVKKGSHDSILKIFERHEADILIGTQMISKGLDYPNVTLVGILNADNGLMHQDYNAAKLTFDLLMQASGRSGRADSLGKVLIQAFNTEHYAIKAVLKQDYEYFYNIEMSYRQKTKYPPYSHLVSIYINDMNDERIKRSVAYIYDRIEKLSYKTYKPIELGKLLKQRRFRILLMGNSLVDMLKDLNSIINEYTNSRNMSSIKVDVDPLYLE